MYPVKFPLLHNKSFKFNSITEQEGKINSYKIIY